MGVITSRNRDDMRGQGSGGRYYQWGSESFISVTTALSNGVPKPALMYWAARVVAEYVAENFTEATELRAQLDDKEFVDLLRNKPWRARDKAADLGTTVHDIAEIYATTGELPDLSGYDPKVRQRVAQFVNFLEVVEPSIYAVEAVVYNREFGYAGTLDLILDIDYEGVKGRYVVDLKSGKAVYAEAALQQTGYRMAEFLGVGDQEIPMPETDGALILHVTAETWKLIPVVTDVSSWYAFRAALHVAKWRTGDGEGYEKEAVGQALAKGRAK